VRSYEEHIPPGHHEAHFSGTEEFFRRADTWHHFQPFAASVFSD